MAPVRKIAFHRMSTIASLRFILISILVPYTLGFECFSEDPHNSQREITRSSRNRLESADEIIRLPLNSSETSEEIFGYTVETPEESIMPRLQTFQSAEEIIVPPNITEIILTRRHADLQSAEERFRARLPSLEITEIISPRLHTLENAEASTSSRSDFQRGIEEQIISNTIQDVPETWKHWQNIMQFLAVAVPAFTIITWVDGPLRVIEAVIYLFYVSAILIQLFRLVHDAGNNNAATSRLYESLNQLMARFAIVCVVFAGLNTLLYRKDR